MAMAYTLVVAMDIYGYLFQHAFGIIEIDPSPKDQQVHQKNT